MKPKTGDIIHIVAYLKQFKYRIDGNKYIFGDDQEELSEYFKNVNSIEKWTPEWRNAFNCHKSKWCNSIKIELWVNKFGWACGDEIQRKNEGSLVSKGSTFEDCIAFTCGLILGTRHNTLTLSTSEVNLPEEVKCFLKRLPKQSIFGSVVDSKRL